LWRGNGCLRSCKLLFLLPFTDVRHRDSKESAQIRLDFLASGTDFGMTVIVK